MNKRNIDLHGPKLSPSEASSRLHGLQSRLTLNKQLIQFLDTYGSCAHLLLREYGATRAFPECCANFSEAEKIAEVHGSELREINRSLQKEIDDLSAQLPQFREQKGI